MKKVGVIGSGRISEQYIRNMIYFYKNLEVVAISGAHLENAVKRAEQFGIEARTNEEIINDPNIDIIVVLTPAPSHAELIQQALNAGKHVYTEKTMTVELEDARRLVELAKEKKLYFGSAPDTFMGAAYQSARKAIEDGMIGDVISFSLSINRNVEFLASIFEFLRLPAGGLGYDYGVYYLTALVALLGPVDDVYAVVKNLSVERTNVFAQSPDFGKTFQYDNESQIYALLNMESGVTGTVSMNGDSNVNDTPFFYIYGSKGILKLSCANDFGGEVMVMPTSQGFGEVKPIILESVSPITGEHRGIGPAEMALSMEKGKPNRASSQMAFHVLDVLSQMMVSSEVKMPVKVMSTCEKPALLSDEEMDELLIR